MSAGSPFGLYERGAEVAFLEDQLGRAASGAGVVVFVEGAAGIGKTTLGHVVADAAARRGFQVLCARGALLEREFPFGIVRQLFDPVLRRLVPAARSRALEGAAALAAPALGHVTADAPADLTPEAVAASLSGAFHGLYWLAANLGEAAPLLVWVDDAHWADGPSAQFLAFMSRRAADLGMLILVAARPAEPAAEAAIVAIRDDPGALLLSPAPLGFQSVAAILRGALACEPDAVFVEACAQRTRGNPCGLIRPGDRT